MKPAAKRLWAILLSLLFLIGGMVMFSSLVLPAYNEVQALRGEKNALAGVLKEEEGLITSASRLLSQFESAADLRRNMNLVLPVKEDIPGIVNQLHGIAKFTDVSVEAVKIELLPLQPQKATVVEPAGALKINLGLRGGYEPLKAYVRAVETNVRVFDVESFIINEGGTKEPLKANLVIRAYYQR